MKRDLLEILACPACKGGLQLEVSEESGDEIVRGLLSCSNCERTYPIEDTIPSLLLSDPD